LDLSSVNVVLALSGETIAYCGVGEALSDLID
jgi:hypothetical protein